MTSRFMGIVRRARAMVGSVLLGKQGADRRAPLRRARPMLGAMALVAAFTPGVANASALCTAINTGGLNFSTTFISGNLNSSTARYSTSVSDQAINGLRAIAGTTDATAGTASFDGQSYGPLISGEQLTLTYTLSGFSGTTQINAAIRRGTGSNASSEAGTALGAAANGSGTISYIATGSETQIAARVSKTGTPNGTMSVSVSCVGTAPTISSVTPSAGPTAGGTAVTIGGSDFTGATAVAFGGTNAQSFTVNSATQITATTPAGTVGATSVAVTTSGGTTTATNAYTYIAAPTVTALAPTSGPVAGGTSVVVTGTNFGGATAVTFGGTPAQSFTVNSATQITAVAPAGSGIVNIQVRTEGGTSATGAANQYAYVAAPTVTALAPAAGGPGGGTSVTLTGTNLTGAIAVGFGATAAQSFTVNSATQITAVAPAGSGIVNVTVRTTGGTSATNASNQYSYVAAPTVAALAPASGSAGGGTSVTLTGTNFAGATAVTFGGTPAQSFTVNSATQIIAVSPPGSGIVNVAATTAGGTSATAAGNRYTYIAAPTVVSIVPTGGSSGGGTPVTITGTGFISGNSYTATFGAATVSATYASATTLTATAPAGSGTVPVTVTNTTTNQAATGSASYSYAAPTVTGLSVTAGPANTARAVTITGTNFTPSATVRVGATAATGVAYISATQLNATLPAMAAGTYDVTVTTGAVTSATSVADQYTYVAAPGVTTAAPNSGSTAGGTSVVITGTNFAGATAVTFGGDPATGFTVNSNTQITATTPARAAGAANIAVTTAGGTGTLAGGYTYIVLNPPAVTASPTNQTIAVDATATFTAAASGSPSPAVQWQVSSDSGASYANVAGATATSYTTPAAVAGDNGKLYRAVFTNSEGSATTTPATLTVVQAPTANNQTIAVTYNTGTAVTLTATDPNTPPRTLTYTVMTAPAHGTLSGTAPNLTYTPAASYIGSDSFTFTAGNGVATSALATITFAVAGPPAPAAPVVNAPANGSIAATTTPTITGTTEAGTTVAVYVDGVVSGNATVTGTTFSYTVAPALIQGSHTVYAVASGAGGPSPNSATNTFTVDTVAPAAPVIQSPANGSTTATLRPTITGTAEAGSTVQIAINGSQVGTRVATGGNYSYAPTADLPVGSNTVSVTTTDFAGNQSPAATSTFTIVALPSVTSITPMQGSASGGTRITVTGTNFTAASTVSVGGTPATAVTIASATSLTATTPAGTAGAASVQVTNEAGASTTNGTFTYVGAPTANAQSVSTAFQTALAITLNGSDPNTPPRTLTYTVLTAPTKGTLTGTAPNLTYTPSAGVRGADSFTFSVSNGTTSSAPATVSITIGDPTITLSTPIATGTVGTAYSSAISVSGGTAPYSLAITAGALPAGISLTSNGTLSGTPTQSGSFTFTVTATDSSPGSGPYSASRSYTLAISAPTLTLAPATLTNATVGTAYSQALTASGGTAPYSYAVTAGALPAGVTLSASGTLSGTPIAGGSFTFTVTATDATSAGNGGPYTVSRGYTLTVTAPTVTLTPAALPAGQSSTAYSQTLSASGGTAPYGYTVTAGTLPAGITLAANGTLAGTPVQSGSFAFTVTATDSSTGSGPYSASRNYTLVIGAPTLTLAPATLTGATVGTAYSQALTASGGTAPYSYAVTAGALPAGVTLSTSGSLSGTPTAGGSFTFTVTATDATTAGNGGPYTASRSYTLGVAAPALTLAPATLPGATTRVAYSQALTASGGTAPYSYAVTAGALPAGLTLSAGGTLSGTPTQAGSFTFTITAADSSTGSGPYAGTRSYTLTVTSPAIAITPPSLPAGTVGTAYSQTFTASGGTGPYTYAVTAGTVPAGMTINAGGVYAGTPTAGGSFTFTVTATDIDGNTASRAYTQAIAAAIVALAPTTLPAAQTRTAYSQTISASGGTAPYIYAVTAGALPTGLTLSASGTLSGTPTQSGSFTFSVSATDSSTGSGPYSGTRSFTLTVTSPTIAITPATLPDATVATAYSQALTASGGTAPYSYAVTAGTLPAGVTLSAGGTLAGTPTTGGTFTFTITATDADGNAGARAYSLGVAAPTITLAPTTLAGATTRIAYSQAVSASGGTAPYTYAVTAGALPAGLTLSASGTLAGTPTQAGSFTFSVTATDSSSGSGPYAGTRTYTLTVASPTIAITPATLPDGTVAAAYNQTLTATGGTAPYTYAVTAGALPTGVTLSASGTLGGTPTTGGTFTFTITATDADSNTGVRTYSLAINAPTIALMPTTLPDAQARITYSQALTASGGTAPYTYAVTAGALPAGITLAANGTLAGTATVAGQFNFSVTARDSSTGSGPYSASNAYTLTVVAPTIAIAPAALPDATTRIAYSQALTATGGTAPYRYAVTAGALPAGVTLSTTGTLAGSATTAGAFAFTVTATDANGNTGAKGYTLTVTQPAIALAPATLPAATTRIAYNQTLTASGGTAPYGYAVTAGALPAGVTLSSGGVLAGTPTTTGSYSFTVTATDGDGNAGSGSYTLAVASPAITLAPTTLPNATARTVYSQTLTATGGTAPYGYTVTAGALPAGVTLSAGGALAGTPTTAGSYTFTVTASDANGNRGAQAYTLEVQVPAIALAPQTLPAPVAGTPYSQTVAASGGAAPYSYAVTAGALPAGLTLATDGTLSGTPTAGGSSTFTVTASDANGNTGSASYSVTTTAATVTLAPATLPAGQSGSPYSQALTASGGTAPYTYAVTAGALPAGVTLAANGTLAGTPTQSGSFAFTVTATDSSTGSGPYSATRSYTLAINAPALTLAPTTLTGATVGTAYSQALTASGGTAPYSYAVTAGALPAGVTLSTSGTLSGTPVAGGSFTFTVTATDATTTANGGPYTASSSYTLGVAAATVTLAPATLPTGQSGSAYGQAISATGGTAPYSYAVTAGALPAGVTLSATGTLAGTPTQSGSFAFTVTATDSSTGLGPYSATRSYTLAITAPALTLAPATLTGATVGTAYSQALTASGGTAPYSYAVTAGTLPAGVTLSTSGTLSGTPAAGGSFTFTVTATDATTSANGGPYTASRSYTLGVAAATVTLAPTTLPAGQSGSAYSQTLAASGGTAPYAYAVTAGALPAGITLAANGTLAGTPTQSGSFTITVTATDSSTGSGPYSATRSYTLAINAPALTLAPTTLTGATVGTAYSQALTASGGTAPYSYAVTAGALPAGVTLLTSGTLSGTPAAGGSFTFTVTATDATTTANGGPYAATRSYTLGVAAATVTLAPATLPSGQSGDAYSQALVASGGTAPYSYAVTAGILPAGVTLAANGTLAGTPTQSGSFAFTVTATDSSTGSGPYSTTRSYTLAINAPALTLAPGTLTGATVGAAYSQVLTASGGTAPYSYAVTAGALPAGVTLSTSGTLSGTPIAGGSFTFTVTATDATTTANGGPYTATRSYTLGVAGATVTLAPATLPAGQSGSAYSQTLTASGGTAPYAYAVTAGALPAGVTLAANGTLAGTPTQSGSFAFTVTATDSSTGSGPYSATRSYTLVIGAPTLTLAPATLTGATVGTAYSQALTASGGTAPYSYAVTAGALPAGVTLSTSGSLSGTPTAGGSFAFTVTATDATTAANGGPYTASRSYTLGVAAATVTLTPATLPAGQSGSAYSQALAASGGTAPYSYAITAGILPAGVTLAANGTLAGTPTQSGSFAFTVNATDSSTGSGPYSAGRSYTLAINAPALTLAPATLAGATVGTIYSQALTASGGTAPYSYVVTTGGLPAGVTLSTSGTLSGTPVAGGSFTFTVTATDATTSANGGPYTASRSYTLAVANASITIAPTALPDGRYQAAYSQALAASGGTAPYSYVVSAGALPAGITLAANGTLTGTPTEFGSFTFTVTATDSSTGSGPYTGSHAYTLAITAPDRPTVGNTNVTVAYGSASTPVPLAITGGTATSVAVTTVPTHGTATANGTAIAYTPVAGYAGPDSFTYTAANAGGSSAPATVSVTVTQPTLALTPATLPAGQQDVAYSQQLTASGGTAPYSYAVTTGQLPDGITLSKGGLITGNPRASGRFAVTVTATDSSTGAGPFSIATAYTLDVSLPAPPVARAAAVSTSTSTTVQNGSVSIDLSALVSGNYTAIRIASQPQHGTVTIDTAAQRLSQSGERTTATYTPERGYIGTDGFGFIAVGAGGTSNEARVAVTVTGVAPVAAAIKTSVTNGQTTIVDLTGAAFGGPFTAASVTTITPADAVEASLVEGGSAGNRSYQLRITPRGRFSGTATIAYTLANAYGTSAPAIITVAIAQRADPSQDATVTGISAAQAEATRRFAQAQLDNFQRRNEQLHNGGAGSQGRPMGISISGGNSYSGRDPLLDPSTSDVVALKSEHASAIMGRERAAGILGFDRNGQPMTVSGLSGARGAAANVMTATSMTGTPAGTGAGASTSAAAMAGDPTAEGPDAIEGSGRKVGSTAVWSGGAIALGTEDATRRRGKLSVSTGGLSSGVDVKLSDALTLGVGGGYGAERAKVGRDQGRVDSDSWMGALYGSLSPADGLFIDGVAGGGRLSFDTIRSITGSTAIARGHRRGSMVFGSLTGGFDRTSATGAFSTYGRIDYLSADLDRYTETGAGTANLMFDRRDVTSLSSVLGLRGSFVAGRFVPRIRGEWRHEFKNGGVQALDYADLGGFTYAIRADGWTRDNYTIEFGTDYVVGNGWRIGFDISGALGQGSRYATEKITVRKQF